MMHDDEFPQNIRVDEAEYDVSKLSAAALEQLRGIKFCEQQIQQLSNEWAVADTARLGYLYAIKSEIKTQTEV